jgi:hypothetical protein
LILSFISTDLRALLAAGDQRVLAQPMQPNRNNPQIQPTQQHEVIVIGNKGGTRDQNTTNTGKGDESNTWNNNDWKNDNKNDWGNAGGWTGGGWKGWNDWGNKTANQAASSSSKPNPYDQQGVRYEQKVFRKNPYQTGRPNPY